MAPRASETKAAFLQRLREAWAREGGAAWVGLGAPHHSHGVVFEGGRWRVRQLELPEEKAAAYLAAHGRFMPEDAELLSEPTGAVVYEAATREELVALIEAGRWPL
ncbi:MAG: hypothetical protein IAE78_32560 [Myxococcus sp.]|nr:hypothetical protein [Myxococcus sp.]